MDEIRTWEEAAQWLPSRVREGIERALPPTVRGWYTPDEADADGGRFIETSRLCDRESRLYRTGD